MGYLQSLDNVSEETLQVLYYAFVQPHVGYGLLVYCSVYKANTRLILK